MKIDHGFFGLSNDSAVYVYFPLSKINEDVAINRFNLNSERMSILVGGILSWENRKPSVLERFPRIPRSEMVYRSSLTLIF